RSLLPPPPHHRPPPPFPTRRSSDLARIHQPAHARISLLGQDLVPGERLSHRFPVAALAQQRATQFDPRNAGVQVLGSLTPALRRSEEHTSELQSLRHLVCRLLLEKK